MRFSGVLGRIAAFSARNAGAVVVLSVLLALAAGLLATRLDTDTGTDTLVDSDTPTFQATERVRENFGEDPVAIVARGDVSRLVLTSNLGQLLRLEGCLAGNPPEQIDPLPGPCTELAELQPAKLVSGPATFLNQAVIGIGEQLTETLQTAQAQARAYAQQIVRRARQEGLPEERVQALAQAAAQQVLQGYQGQLIQTAATYGLTSIPRLDDPTFVSRVVFDSRRAGSIPKAKLSFLFPNRDAAQIIVRLRPDLTDAERRRALDLIQAAVAETQPRKICGVRGNARPCFVLQGADYVVSGAPVVVEGLAGVLKNELFLMFAVALVLMAIALVYVFRSRMRLLPLGIALAASGFTFGLLYLLGGRLTMASIAVLPILIGLAVDYAIQLQARFEEAREAGMGGEDAARTAAEQGGPMVLVACLATAAGLLALQFSPTPMVRDFGVLLVAGILMAYFLALTAGLAAMTLAADRDPLRVRVPAFASRAGAALGRWRARAASGLQRFSRATLAHAIVNASRVLAVAFALAVLGWVAAAQTDTVTDVRELVPQDLAEVRDLEELEDATGVTGELDVVVGSDDMADPDVIEWMADFKLRVLESNGFAGDFPSCRKADICPGPALTDFLGGAEAEVTRNQVLGTVSALPAYDLEAVVTRDPGGGLGDTALIAFAVRTMPLDEQQELIDSIRAQIDPPGPGNGPPEGTTVELAGLPVLAAEASSDLENSRYWLALAGLIAVALALLALYRSVSRALVPLVPIALATGWSSLVLAAMDIPLNPMSAALGALVIAITTEFSVLLSSRFHEEHESGLSLGESLRRAYERTGAAVLASGITAIAGFAALIASDIRMLRDFGLVTVVDLGVALLGVMIVLPAALVWAEEGFRLPRLRLGSLSPAARGER